MSRQRSRGPDGWVRIIGGRWRGRRLPIVPAAAVRPTPNRARETLFNWLAPVIEGAACLDLYAGTGALGFEALSRGARETLFVEREPPLAEALRGRCRELALSPAAAQVLALPVERFLASSSTRRFDVVFLDPPYAIDLAPLLARLAPWLEERALVYVERAAGPAVLENAVGETGVVLKQSRAGAVVYGLVRVG